MHLTYLQADETRQLIEQPARDFPLAYAPDAYQRVLDLTRGHPYLVQLLCMEIVALKNQQNVGVRRLASAADVEAAATEALTRGQQFVVDIERNQISEDERILLRYLAHDKAQQQPDFHTLANHLGDIARCRAALDRLNQRELIEVVADRYQFQAQLIRRWFSRRLVQVQ